ncbi:hypothetical protein Tco_0209541 [Tanacetum coccineum]
MLNEYEMKLFSTLSGLYMDLSDQYRQTLKRNLPSERRLLWVELGMHKNVVRGYPWILMGDFNVALNLEVVMGADNVEVVGNHVADVFVSHYQEFLGTNMARDDLYTEDLFSKKISNTTCSNMVRTVSDVEIKAAMFDIGDDRAPGPDGYTSAFLKKSWDIVGNDVCNAVRDFFTNGQLLKEINHTFIALIPKIIEGIKEVVSDNQSAFVLGRRISDSILITQELMNNYHRDRGPPRCAFKVDIPL